MDTRRTAGGLTQRGAASVQFLIASGLGLVLFLMLANVFVVQYGLGAVRSALDQGARAGAISGAAADCEARVADVLGQLLGGRMSDAVEFDCSTNAGLMVAGARGVFEGWMAGGPDFPFEVVVEDVVERVP